MTSLEELRQRCEKQIRRKGCFLLKTRRGAGDTVEDAIAAFEQCFLPVLKASGRCGVFGPRAEELVGGKDGWSVGEGGGYWKTFTDDLSSARACWSLDEEISLEVSILVPLRLEDPMTVEALRATIRGCYDPNTVSNPTALVPEDAYRFARTNSRKGNFLWLAFRSTPQNLYLSILGKPDVVCQWFRYSIDYASGDLWSRLQP